MNARWKMLLKRILPRPLHHLYNRLISKRIIRRNVGNWFVVDWKRNAPFADPRKWVDVYDESWRHWDRQDLSPDDLERIAEKIPSNVSILDAGCGDGYLLQRIQPTTKRITGVDLSGIALDCARKRLGNDVPLVQSFIEYMPFRDNSFEVVVSAHTLEHVNDLDRAVMELKRIASRRLVILVPAQEYLPYTEDYHLHFFPHKEDLLRTIGLEQAMCERYTVSSSDEPVQPVGKFHGDLLLLTADL